MVTVTAKRILGTHDLDNHFLLVSGNLVTKISIPSKDFSRCGTKFLTSSCLARFTNLLLKSLSSILNCMSLALMIVSLTSKIEETFEIISSCVRSVIIYHQTYSINCFSTLKLNICKFSLQICK